MHIDMTVIVLWARLHARHKLNMLNGEDRFMPANVFQALLAFDRSRQPSAYSACIWCALIALTRWVFLGDRSRGTRWAHRLRIVLVNSF